ncbi:MAG: hypothetical protein AAF480_00840 [Actinomycetota bacterium]
MSASLIAVARTPWAPRHTALDGSRPEDLLAVALAGLVARAAIEPDSIDRVLVACDTSVGAQDLNLGRRAALHAGWERTPALTVDGQGVTGLALVALAAELPGTTVVAGVDASSMVPPGAGLVRDYGRPTLDEPEHRWLDSVAAAHDLDGAALDAAVERARAIAHLTTDATVAMPGGGSTQDTATDQDAGEPFSVDGVVAPHHLAPWADGAVAVLLGPGGDRAIESATVEAVPTSDVVARLVAPGCGTTTVVADNSAVLAALTTSTATPASPLAIGSTPSCDGLRMLADAAAAVDGPIEIRERGGHGQLASVSLAARRGPTDASKPGGPT